jgi:hypothetical protein
VHVSYHFSSSDMMEVDNFHRDTDMHEPEIERSVPSMFVVHRLVMNQNHNYDRSQDVASCDDE